MRPTLKIIAEFVGVFVIGAFAGGLITWSYTDTQLTAFMNHTYDPDSLVARINKKYADEYHLSPDEINRIQPDVKEMAQTMYQIRHQFGVDVVAALGKYHAQIAAKLDPDHRDAYTQVVAERDKKLSALLLPDTGSPTGVNK